MSDGPGRSASAGTGSGRTIVALIAIALLAVVLRVGAIAYTHAIHAPAEENRIIARNLAAGRGFTFTEFTVTGPTAIRGPVYPMVLALVGPNRMGVILGLNVLIGAATVFAAYSLTRRLLSSLPVLRGRAREGVFSSAAEEKADPLPNPLPEYREREPDPVTSETSVAPILAAALFATWPTQVYAAKLSQGLSLAVLLTLASLAFAFRRTPGSLIAAGLLAGLAALTEPVLALPLLLCAIVLGWRDRQRLWHGQDAAVFVFAAMVLIAPWLYRNAIVFGRPMPITSNFWRDVYLGNGPGMTIRNHDSQAHVDANNRATVQTLTRIERLPANEFDQLKVPEPKRVRVFAQWAWRDIQADPSHYLGLCFSRLLDGRDESNPLHNHWLNTIRLAIPAIALIAFIFSGDRRVGVWLALGVALIAGLALSTAFSRLYARNIVLQEIMLVTMVSIAIGRYVDRRGLISRKTASRSVQGTPSRADNNSIGTP